MGVGVYHKHRVQGKKDEAFGGRLEFGYWKCEEWFSEHFVCSGHILLQE